MSDPITVIVEMEFGGLTYTFYGFPKEMMIHLEYRQSRGQIELLLRLCKAWSKQ